MSMAPMPQLRPLEKRRASTVLEAPVWSSVSKQGATRKPFPPFLSFCEREASNRLGRKGRGEQRQQKQQQQQQRLGSLRYSPFDLMPMQKKQGWHPHTSIMERVFALIDEEVPLFRDAKSVKHDSGSAFAEPPAYLLGSQADSFCPTLGDLVIHFGKDVNTLCQQARPAKGRPAHFSNERDLLSALEKSRAWFDATRKDIEATLAKLKILEQVALPASCKDSAICADWLDLWSRGMILQKICVLQNTHPAFASKDYSRIRNPVEFPWRVSALEPTQSCKEQFIRTYVRSSSSSCGGFDFNMEGFIADIHACLVLVNLDTLHQRACMEATIELASRERGKHDSNNPRDHQRRPAKWEDFCLTVETFNSLPIALKEFAFYWYECSYRRVTQALFKNPRYRSAVLSGNLESEEKQPISPCSLLQSVKKFITRWVFDYFSNELRIRYALAGKDIPLWMAYKCKYGLGVTNVYYKYVIYCIANYIPVEDYFHPNHAVAVNFESRCSFIRRNLAAAVLEGEEKVLDFFKSSTSACK